MNHRINQILRPMRDKDCLKYGGQKRLLQGDNFYSIAIIIYHLYGAEKWALYVTHYFCAFRPSGYKDEYKWRNCPKWLYDKIFYES